MFDLLFIASIIGTCIEAIKEFNKPIIPADNWTNKELMHEDIMNGMSIEEHIKNLKNGRYKQHSEPTWYQEPHRNKDGSIIIENCLLYENDLLEYGVVQTYKWVEQGKYNLTPEELEKENKRIKKEYDKLLGFYS